MSAGIRHRISALGPSLAGLLLAVPAAALDPGYPGLTQPASTDPAGTLSMQLGAGYRKNARDFGIADREHQWNLGAVRLTAGLGERIEVQASGVVHLLARTDGRTRGNWGDWTLGTKIRLFDEGPRRPAVGLLWEVKLPIASDERGGGTDETDFYAHLLLSRSLNPYHSLHLNAGIGLLGDPERNSAQNDVFLLRAAWTRQAGKRGLTGLELLFGDGFRENDSPLLLRGLASRSFGSWQLNIALAAGLNSDSDDLAADISLGRRFGPSGPAPAPAAALSPLRWR